MDANDIPEGPRKQISDSMNSLANLYSTVSTYRLNIPVGYSASSGLTAQANYNGSMTFGTQRNLRTALHESGHFMGVGAIQPWTSRIVNGAWQGSVAQSRVKAFDGDNAEVRGDRAHFWPYGMNQDSEFGPRRATRTVHMLGALRADMGERGMTDGTSGTPGEFRLINRQSNLMLEDRQRSEAGPVAQAESHTATSQKWKLSFDNGHITLVNAASVRYLSARGGNALLLSAPAVTGEHHWEMQATDNGYFKLHDRVNGLCLQGVAGTANVASTTLGSCSATADNTTDQWHLAQ